MDLCFLRNSLSFSYIIFLSSCDNSSALCCSENECCCCCWLHLFSHVRLLATPQTAAYQAPPSMGCSRQENWSGLPLPSPYRELVRGVSLLPDQLDSNKVLADSNFLLTLLRTECPGLFQNDSFFLLLSEAWENVSQSPLPELGRTLRNKAQKIVWEPQYDCDLL